MGFSGPLIMAIVISAAAGVLPLAGSGDPVPSAAVAQAVAPTLEYGAEGAWAEELNSRLTALGFHAGEGSTFDKLTRHAVYAFQKYHGLDRTGVFTPDMWDLLEDNPVLPWRREKDRVEIDLARQLLFVVEGGDVVLVIPVSSGNGETYRDSNGSRIRATTPEGTFAFERQIDGLRRSYLGVLYRPFYFKGGYAVHGSPSVPNYPASHGCVRVTNWDMDLLREHFQIGETVLVYGQRTDRPGIDDIELPVPSYQ